MINSSQYKCYHLHALVTKLFLFFFQIFRYHNRQSISLIINLFN